MAAQVWAEHSEHALPLHHCFNYCSHRGEGTLNKNALRTPSDPQAEVLHFNKPEQHRYFLADARLQSFAECSGEKQAADASLFSSSGITDTCSRFNTKSRPIIVHVASNLITHTRRLISPTKCPGNATPYIIFPPSQESWVYSQSGVGFTCSPVEIISCAIPAEGSMAGLFRFGSFHSFTPNVHASIKKPSVAMFGQPLAPARGSFKIRAVKMALMASYRV